MSEAATILITGACLQGNKGGPALILSLVDLITRSAPGPFRFAVAAGREIERERVWAQRYGFELVEELSLRAMLPPWRWSPASLRSRRAHTAILRRVDAVADVSGVAYVGPPRRGVRQSLPTYLRGSAVLAAGVPYLRFTQSYGPFSSAAMRRLARRELSRLDIVLARGKESAERIAALGFAAKTRAFPDVAMALTPAAQDWAEAYLEDTWSIPAGAPLVTISPSSTAERHLDQSGAGADRHVACCVAAIGAILARDPESRCLIVPHTVRPEATASSTTCDLVLSRRVLSGIDRRIAGRVHLEEGDRDARELKALIARSEFHLGARYHSLVAALSSGVPAVAFAWHHKYQDLLAELGVGDCALPQERVADLEGAARFMVEKYAARAELRDVIARRLPGRPLARRGIGPPSL